MRYFSSDAVKLSQWNSSNLNVLFSTYPTPIIKIRVVHSLLSYILILSILKNGSDIGTAAVNYPNTSWSEGYHFGELIIDLAVADYIEVAVNQASGSTKDMRTDADYYQRFYCIYLGA